MFSGIAATSFQNLVLLKIARSSPRVPSEKPEPALRDHPSSPRAHTPAQADCHSLQSPPSDQARNAAIAAERTHVQTDPSDTASPHNYPTAKAPLHSPTCIQLSLLCATAAKSTRYSTRLSCALPYEEIPEAAPTFLRLAQALRRTHTPPSIPRRPIISRATLLALPSCSRTRRRTQIRSKRNPGNIRKLAARDPAQRPLNAGCRRETPLSEPFRFRRVCVPRKSLHASRLAPPACRLATSGLETHPAHPALPSRRNQCRCPMLPLSCLASRAPTQKSQQLSMHR